MGWYQKTMIVILLPLVLFFESTFRAAGSKNFRSPPGLLSPAINISGGDVGRVIMAQSGRPVAGEDPELRRAAEILMQLALEPFKKKYNDPATSDRERRRIIGRIKVLLFTAFNRQFQSGMVREEAPEVEFMIRRVLAGMSAFPPRINDFISLSPTGSVSADDLRAVIVEQLTPAEVYEIVGRPYTLRYHAIVKRIRNRMPSHRRYFFSGAAGHNAIQNEARTVWRHLRGKIRRLVMHEEGASQRAAMGRAMIERLGHVTVTDIEKAVRGVPEDTSLAIRELVETEFENMLIRQGLLLDGELWRIYGRQLTREHIMPMLILEHAI